MSEMIKGATNTQDALTDKGFSSLTGLVVHASPENLEGVQEKLLKLTGVEVHDTAPEGKMVVTVEELPGQKTMVDTITAISHVEGVLSTSLVYTHNDDWSEA